MYDKPRQIRRDKFTWTMEKRDYDMKMAAAKLNEKGAL